MNPVILYDNRLRDGAPTVTDQAGDEFDVQHLSDGRDYTFWKAASEGLKFIRIDCGAAKFADTFALSGHNLGTLGATVRVEASEDGAIWNTVVPDFTPADDRAVMKRFPLAEVRYYGIRVTTSGGTAEIATAMIGQGLVFPFPPETPYVPARVVVEKDNTRSKSGNLLGTLTRFLAVEISPQWTYLPRQWFEAHVEPFYYRHASRGGAFFYAWDLDARPRDVFLVQMDNDYEMPVVTTEIVPSFKLDMIGTIHGALVP